MKNSLSDDVLFFTAMNKNHFFMTFQRKHLYFFIPKLFIFTDSAVLSNLFGACVVFKKTVLYKDGWL